MMRWSASAVRAGNQLISCTVPTTALREPTFARGANGLLDTAGEMPKIRLA